MMLGLVALPALFDVGCRVPDPPAGRTYDAGGAEAPPSLSPTLGQGEQTAFSSAPIVPLAADWSDAAQAAYDPSGMHVFTGLDGAPSACPASGGRLCLDVPNGQPALGTRVHVFCCNLIASAQSWSLVDGQLRVADDQGATWCLGVAAASGAAPVPTLAPCTAPNDPNSSQGWSFTDGMLRLEAQNTCLGLTASLPAPQTALTTSPCDANNAVQKWRLANLGQVANANVVTPIGLRANAVDDPNMCLDLNHGDATAGLVQAYPCNLGSAQKWVFEGGSITTQGRACLGVAGAASAAAGAQVMTLPCLEDDPTQIWEVAASSLRHQATGLCACLPPPGAAGGDPGPIGPLALGACPSDGSPLTPCQWLLGLP